VLDTNARSYFNTIFKTLANFLLSLHAKPLHVTIVALIVGLIGAFSFYMGLHVASFILLWLSGLLDVLDGEMARGNNTSSSKGALLDIFFDRVVEIAYIFAFVGTASNLSLLVLTSSIILSMTIFLSVGAMSHKSSKKSFYYQAGLIERTEAFIFFSLIIVFSDYATYIVYFFAFCIFFTVGQRLKEALNLLD